MATEYSLKFERVSPASGLPPCPVVTLARDVPPEGDIISVFLTGDGPLIVMNEPYQQFTRAEWDSLIEAAGQLQLEEDQRRAT